MRRQAGRHDYDAPRLRQRVPAAAAATQPPNPDTRPGRALARALANRSRDSNPDLYSDPNPDSNRDPDQDPDSDPVSDTAATQPPNPDVCQRPGARKQVCVDGFEEFSAGEVSRPATAAVKSVRRHVSQSVGRRRRR